jgi:hypothetical protein
VLVCAAADATGDDTAGAADPFVAKDDETVGWVVEAAAAVVTVVVVPAGVD